MPYLDDEMFKLENWVVFFGIWFIYFDLSCLRNHVQFIFQQSHFILVCFILFFWCLVKVYNLTHFPLPIFLVVSSIVFFGCSFKVCSSTLWLKCEACGLLIFFIMSFYVCFVLSYHCFVLFYHCSLLVWVLSYWWSFKI